MKKINEDHMIKIEPIGQILLHSPAATERKSKDQCSHQKGGYRIVKHTIEDTGECQMVFHHFPYDICQQNPPLAFL